MGRTSPQTRSMWAIRVWVRRRGSDSTCGSATPTVGSDWRRLRSGASSTVTSSRRAGVVPNSAPRAAGRDSSTPTKVPASRESKDRPPWVSPRTWCSKAPSPGSRPAYLGPRLASDHHPGRHHLHRRVEIPAVHSTARRAGGAAVRQAVVVRRWRSSSAAPQHRTGDFEARTGGYALLELSLGVRLHAGGRLHAVSLRADNLTNREDRNHLSRLQEILPEPGVNVSLLYRLTF